MKCEKCGSPVSEGLSFCPSCGSPLSTQQGTPPPPQAPKRAILWVGIAVAVVLIAALATIIPLALRDGGEPVSTTTTATTTSTSEPSTTTEAPTTTTTVAGPVGDSSGSWVETPVPGGPWAAVEVAVSEKALLVVTAAPAGHRLSAIMLESGEVSTVSESEALFGIDIDGDMAVWWEATGWDAGTASYAHQYIKSLRLPDGDAKTLASDGPVRLSMPQVAAPWVTWVGSELWADDPEYWSMRILGVRVADDGSPAGPTITMVPAALAFALGDSGWQYSLSSTRLAWENHAEIGGYGLGTHVLRTDLSGDRSVGGDVWRPTLWDELLVYKDGSLRLHDLATDVTRPIDPAGDFATAGPTFAAFYKPSSSGSYLVVRGYGGTHEQTLGELSLPPYFCPPIAVSANHVAYAFDDQVHLFEWRPE